MVRGQTYWILLSGAVVLVVSSAIVGYFSPEPNAGFRDASAVLALATSLAVGIERTIEGFWTAIGQLKSAWWPLDVPDHAMEKLAANLTKTLTPLFQQVDAKVAQAATAGAWTEEQMASAKGELAKLQQAINDAVAAGVGGGHGMAAAGAIRKQVAALEQQYQLSGPTVQAVRDQLDGLVSFITTFRENPGRRLISLFMGAILGLGAAGLLGLDMVHAAAGTTSTSSFHWGVAVTGLVLGLGSSPTHELIRSIQEYKQSRKAESGSTPSVS
jgi:hypothetical protein